MTGGRVLKGEKPGSFAEQNGGRNKGMAEPGQTAPAVQVASLTVQVKPGDVIKNLQAVVVRLQTVEKLNNNLQGQYMQGSAAWESCEKIDDELHEIYTLLGE